MKPRKIAIEDINRRIEADARGYMRKADAEYRAQIEEIARDIEAHRREKGLILLTGPSGSGKTTSARMLEGMLDSWGCETHTISMDDYFAPFTKEQWEEIERGELDFESPNRIDIAFLNEQLERIAACQPVSLPTYDFQNSKRLFTGKELRRKPGEIVIYEGIHALNPEVILLPGEQTARVYVSVRTRVTVEGQAIHPSYVRLLRRLIRDRRTRGRAFSETAAMFENVERGEQTYIAPHKHRAEYELDSFQPYELAVYKSVLAEDAGALISGGIPEQALMLLSQSAEAERSLVPENALIREFVGKDTA